MNGGSLALNGTDRRDLLIAFVIILPLSIALPTYLFNSTLEDAHITFRYVRNFVAGQGFGIWNRDEQPIEGFTSLAWLIILSAGSFLGLSIFTFSKGLGWLFLACLPTVSLIAWYRSKTTSFDRSDSRRENWLLYAAILYVVYVPVAWYAVSGMETVFVAAQVAFLLYVPRVFTTDIARSIAVVLSSACLIVTRPEGILISVAINLFFLHQEVKQKGHRNWPVTGLIAALITFIGLTSFRYYYFGELVPNTYYAKADGGLLHLVAGVYYVKSLLTVVAPLIAFVVAAYVIRRREMLNDKFAAFLTIFLFVYCLYVIKVGGDPISAFPLWRHFLHIAPFWITLVALSVYRLFPKFLVGLVMLLIAAVAVDGVIAKLNKDVLLFQPIDSIKRFGLLKTEPPNEFFIWLSKFVDQDTLSAGSLAGQWSYFVPGQYIDMLGLNDRHIARFGSFDANGPIDSKTDMKYVMSRSPDVIDGYMSGLALKNGLCPIQNHGWRFEMLNGLIRNPYFLREYDFVLNAPYDKLDRAIFVRKEFLSRHMRDGLQAIPVADGPLYRYGCPR